MSTRVYARPTAASGLQGLTLVASLLGVAAFAWCIALQVQPAPVIPSTDGLQSRIAILETDLTTTRSQVLALEICKNETGSPVGAVLNTDSKSSTNRNVLFAASDTPAQISFFNGNISFDQEIWDDAEFWDAAAPSKIVIPENGTYSISAVGTFVLRATTSNMLPFFLTSTTMAIQTEGPYVDSNDETVFRRTTRSNADFVPNSDTFVTFYDLGHTISFYVVREHTAGQILQLKYNIFFNGDYGYGGAATFQFSQFAIRLNT